MKAGADAAPKTSAAQKAPKSAPSLKNEEKPFFAPAMPPVQTKLKVGSPNDPAEKEADNMADKVMRMPADKPAASVSAGRKIQTKKEEKPGIQAKHKDSKKIRTKGDEKKIQKKEEKILQRKGEGTPITATNEIGEGIRQQSAGGFTLSDDTRSFMETRFNADFSNVRIHTGPESAQLNNQLGAKAFTYQNHIFFNHNQYQPEAPAGKHLLAHELTHTIQQGQSIQRAEATKTEAAKPAMAAPATTAMAPQIQRFLGIDIPSWQDVLDWLAEKAYHIPGYRMFTIVIGVNPINGESADRSAANILRAIVEFLPGGHLITQALDKYNVFEKAGSWVEQQLKRFSGLMGEVKSAVKQFMDDLDFLDIILHPVRTWERAVAIFTKPVNDIIDFIKSIFQAIMQFIRDAVLKPLAELAARAPGFDLLCAVLGTNPITGETVPRNADTLIGGFMKMIGRQDIWENIKKGNAIQRAFDWFQKAMKGLITMVTSFPGQFIAMLKSLEVMDFIVLPNLFRKVFGVFGSFASAFFNWAFNTIFDLLEIIFSVVAPGAMPYLSKVRSAFRSIIEKPMVFVGHLINAVKKGFNQFKDRIGTWLKKALISWLLGSLEGANLYIPQSFSLKELLKLGLSVFGLTWQNFRVKLVKALGETAVAALETGFDILKTLVTEGPAAAWDKIQDKIEELKSQFIQEVTTFVTVTVVQKAIVKLLSSLNPAGAFIQAILAIYDTIMFVIQKIKQIAQVGMAVVNSIVEIASGNISKAANAVENVLGGLLKMAISFLANFLGLGKISDKVVEIIKKLRAPVDKAMDKLVDWIVTGGKKLLGGIKNKVLGWLGVTQGFTAKDGESHTISFKGKDANANLYVNSRPKLVTDYLNELAAIPENGPYIGAARSAFDNIAKLKANDPGDDPAKVTKQKNDIEAEFKKLAAAFSQMKGGTQQTMENVAIVFNRSSLTTPVEHKEFDDQLEMQKNALNNMTILIWLRNRNTFEQIGRSKQGTRAMRRERTLEWTNLKNQYIAAGKTPADAEKLADADMKGKAKLHVIDQVAGGYDDEFAKASGLSRVNSIIGPGWVNKIPLILDKIKKVDPKAQETAKINVTLS
ncbi:eCIS core domain-containing protein [Chitinophaga sp. 22536]|uniref:eCIS core domain-containing protein n=1 Tax=unclassified Chitinophaga TaxID=2619133 RepID=UPI003F84FF41